MLPGRAMSLRSSSGSYLARDDSSKAERVQLWKHLLIVGDEGLEPGKKKQGGGVMTTAFKYC